MKQAFALLILVIGLAAALDALAVTEGQTLYVAVTEARIRAEPSMEAETRDYAYRNDEALATGRTSGEWLEVCREPVVGWMHYSVLSLDAPGDSATGTIIGDGRVRLRDAPGGNPMDWVHPGDVATIYQAADHAGGIWYRVTCNGLTGWVSGDYLLPA